MSVWDEARMGGNTGGRHALGFWDPRYKLASLAWVPPVSQRKQIYGKRRYVYCINFPTAGVASAGTLQARVAFTSDFWWTDTIASTPFQFQQNLTLYDTKNGVRYTNIPVFNANLSPLSSSFGGFSTPPFIPYFERRITKIPEGAVLLARMQVQFAGAFSDPPQVCLGGYID